MSKTPILLAVLGIVATVFIAPDASAGRVRAHVGGHTANGGRFGATKAVAHDARGTVVRSHGWHSDGDGNVSGGSKTRIEGANGGSAQQQTSFDHNADGTNSASRSSTATGSKGNTYTGSTSYSTGSGISHTAICTDSAGNTITCPGAR